jgi:transposase
VSMTGKIDRVEVITSVRRRRRWSAEKGADRAGDLRRGCRCRWWRGSTGQRRTRSSPGRRLYAEGALSAVGAGEEVVPASEYRALQHQVRELQRLLGKKTLENEVLRDALELVQPKNGCCARRRPFGTARCEDGRRYPRRRAVQSRRASSAGTDPPASRAASAARTELVAEIQALIVGQPT